MLYMLTQTVPSMYL